MDTGSIGLKVLEILSPVLLAALTWAAAKLAQLIRAKVQNGPRERTAHPCRRSEADGRVRGPVATGAHEPRGRKRYPTPGPQLERGVPGSARHILRVARRNPIERRSNGVMEGAT